MNSFDFTAGEDGNIFLPGIEEPRSSSAAVYGSPQPLLRFRGQNSLLERMRIGLVRHRNSPARLHRIFEELSHSDRVENGGRRFRAWATLASGFRRHLASR